MENLVVSVNLRWLLLCLVEATLVAAPSVTKVEPPNWWVRHTRNPIQVLLTGSELNGASVAAPKGFRVEVRRTSENGHYLFAYVTIDRSTKAGAYRFEVKGPGGTATFPFSLDAPLDPKGRFQGFSPDDVIYLAMPDRFANGDASNDSPPDLGRPANRSVVGATHGGDLRGIRDHLGYLKDLGVTGVWVTPIYRNSLPGLSSYHGYSAVDFYAVEPRFGTMQDFRELVDAAHRMGLKVVQDQVANHSGPRHPFVSDPPTPTWWHDLARQPKLRNNFDIAALADPYARPKRRQIPLDRWFAGSLPDFNQSDPLVSDYLIQNALWWIGMSGIDGVRQDTYPYVDRPFWEKWQSAIDLQYPDFVVTGEVTAGDPVNAFLSEGRTGDAATVFSWMRSLLHFRLDHPALLRGDLVELSAGKDQYIYLRSSPEEHVLVVLNRGVAAKAVEIEVEDLHLAEGLRFKSFLHRRPDAAVAHGKIVLQDPNNIDIYWAQAAHEF